MKNKNMFDMYPLLEVADKGCISDTVSICKYLANDTTFMGDQSDKSMQAAIEQDIQSSLC